VSALSMMNVIFLHVDVFDDFEQGSGILSSTVRWITQQTYL